MKTTPTKASVKMYSESSESSFKSPKNLQSSLNGENRRIKEIKAMDGIPSTRSGKRRNIIPNCDDSLKANVLEKRNKKSENKKTIRVDSNTSELSSEDIKSLDDIISSHSITDFLNLD